MAERLRIAGVGGRVGYLDPKTGRLFVAHLEEAEDGRLEVVEVFVTSNGEALTTDDLRAVPLRTIEALANQALTSIVIKKSLQYALDPLEDDVKKFRRPVRMEDVPEVNLRLPKRTGTKYPDSFYKQVGEAYEALVSTEARPAVRLAEVNRVPVSTAHRWIKRARELGYLARGRAGKAG